MIKKLFVMVCVTVFVSMCSMFTVFAEVGQMGFFGGINQGTPLPKTTELILSQTSSKKNKSATTTTIYKEVSFLTGEPIELEGTLAVKNSGNVVNGTTSGTYTVSYEVTADDATREYHLHRNITYDVNYRVEGSQTVKDYKVTKWTEGLHTPYEQYELEPEQSHFGVSILEDKTPGVTYYKGDMSQRLVYSIYLLDVIYPAGGAEKITVETSGSLYGYDCAWSNTETHRVNTQIFSDGWQMEYQVRPSVSVNKTLQYSPNEPSAISFPGNYREVLSNKSGLQYDIFVLPLELYDVPKHGSLFITMPNDFEQLIAPDTNFLKGHPAEADIKKLFSMGILEDSSKFYQPSQAITRGQYISMLIKAIKYPVDPPLTRTSGTNRNNNNTVNILFPDVTSDRPDYRYIMAAYKAGLAIGRGNGYFYADYSIQREEALVILLRTLGLSNLGLDPTPVTPFVDDAEVSDWARQDLYAAYKLGLIYPDADGKIKPKEEISKAEGAALVNRLIDYMRSGLQTDYTDNIVPYAD